MLVSTMSLTEMRDECLKELQHYINVAFIKYKSQINFREKKLEKDFIFKTKRNNNLFIRIKFIINDNGIPTLLSYPYFWYYDDKGVAILAIHDDTAIFVYRGHVIKRIIERFRLSYKPEVLIRNLIKLTITKDGSASDINDEFECHIVNKHGVFYYKITEPGFLIAKTFISREMFFPEQVIQFKKEEEQFIEEINNMSEEEYQEMRREMGYL